MKLSENKKKEYVKRILYSRLRILSTNGFYGSLLMHLKYGIDEECETAYTNGYMICFSPKFMDELSDSELDFIMMHEVMHIVLKHVFRGNKYDSNLFNIACDIVVNSNILKSNNYDLKTITLKKYGCSMHLTPKGDEGYNYTAEEVYNMLTKQPFPKQSKTSIVINSNGDPDSATANRDGSGSIKTIDDHSKWEQLEGDRDGYIDEWDLRLTNAIDSENMRSGYDNIPLGALRIYKELKSASINWKMLLKDFLQREINDYSFTPPDRRYDGDFFLPDYNEYNDNYKDINVFVAIDSSGSISVDELTTFLSELKGAFDEDETLKGYVGYFDAALYDIRPFNNIEDILKAQIQGNGGTSFYCPFEGIKRMQLLTGEKPNLIIIFTDGDAPFPNEKIRENIPVLWIVNNMDYNPPWGMVARI